MNQNRLHLTPRAIFSALCISILILGSCRKSPKTKESPSTADGNLTIQLNYLGADLRAGEDDPMSAIESLDLYFFSSESEPAERTMVARRSFGKADLSTSAPLSISLPVSSYYLVAVLNATPFIQNLFGQGVSWSKISEPIDKFSNLYTKVANKVTSVVWSNDQGPIHIEEGSFAKGASAVQVPLARTIARVRLFGEPKVAQHISIDLTNGGIFRMGNRARKIFLMRELAPLIDVSGNPMEKPGDGSDFSSRYAYSPGYQEIATSSKSDYKALAETYRIANVAKSIFNLESLKLIPKKLDACDLSQKLYYTSETTIDPNHATYCFLPSLLIGYKLFPASLGTLPNFTADEGWVSFDGSYYRGRDFVTYLKAIYNRNKSTENNKPTVSVPADYPQSLQKVCEEFVATYGDKILISSSTYQGELYPIDFKGLRYYLRSYNYYYLPIRHTPDQEGYGHYGVVRNNDYRIEIKSISDYGSPILLQPQNNYDKYAVKQAITSTITLIPLTEHNDTATL